MYSREAEEPVTQPSQDPSRPQDPGSPSPVAAVVVLAAGGGTRMKSTTSKLLHRVAGQTMLSYAVSAAGALDPQNLVVVVGHNREQVLEHLHDIAPEVRTAVQEEQKGTGHAVGCGLVGLEQITGEVVVTYGDVPMLTGETLVELVEAHRSAGNKATVMTAVVPDPTGYGRVIRDGDRVARIVEQKDASPDEAEVREINSGIYVFDAEVLRHGLSNLDTDNAQGELYLTDVITIANRAGHRVGAHIIDDLWQTEGVNDRVQLGRMHAEMNRRIVEKWQRAGVTVLDPTSTWIESEVDLGQDVTLLPNTHLEGATSIASGATIGPDTTLRDVEVGEGATVIRSHAELAVVGPGAVVGPFAHLRPGAQLGQGTTAAGFVAIRNATIGDGSTIAPLSYVGGVGVEAGSLLQPGAILIDAETIHVNAQHTDRPEDSQ
ncbi:bifunctional UDP-N-acetylglucosamine diphosphorylase/glucosamine-1-phosphate N-acetyltransferase GlmU [Tessaracoccus sp. SD287]|uniref:bifunctional UDP-N-acetylglucosamine diphosphorylase/glucosamine-1-phosphate N-acetyltransferase GlmU n=1 Tax=Tessaracoccus sp. SD287 TaxID=2782008 RepID=UPI001A96C919|nr:bifunctional UDP-N-acetylglucosamine diphosphorylase/glucosamine-1-phosphate N-acetyltransferase GlmU [Tessaracoccus sp. SD287]MBO1031070.1 bifunctional UDP-N-acetylglucosamine diphosphorylase/glucosamine-1-phosphate N-acetyltransferase GlmU [Tessaracoccus sp. SD287]